MNMQQLGYFIYMDKQEKKKEQEKVNAEKNNDLKSEKPTTKEKTR